MIKKYLILFFVLLLSQLKAHANFNYDANCIAAYNAKLLSKKKNSKTHKMGSPFY